MHTRLLYTSPQGSEYPGGRYTSFERPRMHYEQKFVYTGRLSIAKKCVTIVGDEQTFYEMIQNNSQQRRYSGLRDRIVEETI